MINFAPRQRLEGVQVPLNVIRMSEFVKDADRAHLVGGAAEHALVCRVDSEAAILDLGDGNSNLSTFEDRAEFLLAFTDGQLEGAALRDIQKGDHGADGLAAAGDRMSPVFDGETCTVAAPEHFVIGMKAPPGTKCLNDAAIFRGKLRPISAGMMAKRVEVLPEHLTAGGKPEYAQSGGIDEGAETVAIDAVDPLGGGIEDEADAFFLFGKPLFDSFALSDDGSQD